MISIIHKPLLTEKTLGLTGKSLYTFRVDVKATKNQIAHEVAQTFKVKVLSVRTISMHGKIRRVGKRMLTKSKSDWKKAMVQIEKGQTIAAFQIAEKEAPKK